MSDILIGNIRGPQGATGATGAQGPQGDAATIEVGTVSTTAYGNPAQVTNSGTASEAVFDFVIPAGRPGEETTSMSALTLDTITAQTATFPVPAVGERGAVVFGKIIKFFSDTVASLANKLNISDVVNNLTSTATNKPLSAAQGRVLNESMIGCMGRKSYTYEYTVAANSEVTITGAQMGTNDVTGKIPMAITAYNTGNVNVYPRSLAAHANAGGGVMRLKNASSSSITATASITILYIKTSMNENL